MTYCQPAETDEVTASYYPGVLTLRASGTLAETCWRVTISKSPLAIWPPEFIIEQCRTSEVCREVLLPYSVETRFPMNAIPEHVVIHDAQGRREIPLDVAPDVASAQPSDADAVKGSFIGYSYDMSYDSALSDAVAQVPLSSKPDQGYFRFVVTDVRGEFGGIGGLRRLAVRIETE